jgi:tRNA dimethylallyltransferase
MNAPLRIILGPTASGKERAAIKVAQKVDADLISVDSMKIYRDMNIGTATPSKEFQYAINHWCINIVAPSDSFSLAQYIESVEAAMENCARSNRKYIFSGGTPLYYKGLTEGIFDGPSASPEIRSELQEYAVNHGVDALYNELVQLDPEIAKKIHPNDIKRVIRAIEVIKLTGKKMSELQTQFGQLRQDRPIAMVGLLWSREELHKRINLRVDIMIKEGLLKEAKSLFESSIELSPQASAAVGYAELFSHFRGEIELPEAIELIKRNTRRLAKSQMTWFRKFDCDWIDMNNNLSPEQIADQVISLWNKRLGK